MAVNNGAKAAMIGFAKVSPRPPITSPSVIQALRAHEHRTVGELDAVFGDVVGKMAREVARQSGEPIEVVRDYLGRRGLRSRGGKIERPALVHETEHTIAERVATAPPSAPCFRCGAARDCEHR